jgi:hypothetical protein
VRVNVVSLSLKGWEKTRLKHTSKATNGGLSRSGNCCRSQLRPCWFTRRERYVCYISRRRICSWKRLCNFFRLSFSYIGYLAIAPVRLPLHSRHPRNVMCLSSPRRLHSVRQGDRAPSQIRTLAVWNQKKSTWNTASTRRTELRSNGPPFMIQTPAHTARRSKSKKPRRSRARTTNRKSLCSG